MNALKLPKVLWAVGGAAPAPAANGSLVGYKLVAPLTKPMMPAWRGWMLLLHFQLMLQVVAPLVNCMPLLPCCIYQADSQCACS